MTSRLKIFVIFQSSSSSRLNKKSCWEKWGRVFKNLTLCKCQCNNVVQTKQVFPQTTRFLFVSKLTLQRRLNVAENSLLLLMIWRKLSMVKWFWRRNSLKLPLTKPLRVPSISVIRTGGALFRLLFFLLELHDCSAWCHLHSFIPQVLSQNIQETAGWKIFFHTSIQIRAVKIVISSDTFNLLTKTAQEHKHEIIVAWKPT